MCCCCCNKSILRGRGVSIKLPLSAVSDTITLSAMLDCCFFCFYFTTILLCLNSVPIPDSNLSTKHYSSLNGTANCRKSWPVAAHVQKHTDTPTPRHPLLNQSLINSNELATVSQAPRPQVRPQPTLKCPKWHFSLLSQRTLLPLFHP